MLLTWWNQVYVDVTSHNSSSKSFSVKVQKQLLLAPPSPLNYTQVYNYVMICCSVCGTRWMRGERGGKFSLPPIKGRNVPKKSFSHETLYIRFVCLLLHCWQKKVKIMERGASKSPKHIKPCEGIKNTKILFICYLFFGD